MSDPHLFDDLTDPAQLAVGQAVEAAVGSAWSFFVRTAGQGLDWDDIHGCQSQADYRARLAAEPGLLLETCQALLEYGTGLTDQEQADCRRVVAIGDALALRGPPAPPPPAAVPAAPAVPVAAPAPDVAAAGTAAAAEPSRARPGRAGRWFAGLLLALGTAAALAWLWNQPSARPALRPVPTGSAAAVPALVPTGSADAAEPAPVAPATPATPAPRPAPSASATASAPRPGATPTPARSPEPAPTPRITVPVVAPSPASTPTVPSPAATAG